MKSVLALRKGINFLGATVRASISPAINHTFNFVRPVTPMFRNADNLKTLTKDQVPPETFLFQLQKDPVAAYKNFESNPFEASDSQPLLLKLIADLNERLQPGSVLELDVFKEFKQALLHLRNEGIALIHRNIPLSDFNAFVLKYVETLDRLFRSTDPELKGTYHRDLAQGYMKTLLNARDGTRLFFTTHEVNELSLLDIRPAAMYLNWVINLPPFSVTAKDYKGGPLVPADKIKKLLDGLLVDTEEITKHDLGHTFLMKRQDAWLFQNSSLSRIELVEEWTRNKNQILAVWKPLFEKDPTLAEAIKNIIFFVIHDKGYQFDLSILRQQLHSPKWVDMVRFNQTHGYYGKRGVTDEVDKRLEEARQWLFALVEKMIKEANLKNISTLNADVNPVIIKKWNMIEAHQGKPVSIELNGVQDFKIGFDVEGHGLKSTSLYLISLVLAPTAKNPILTAEKIDQLEKWLWQKKHTTGINSLMLRHTGDVIADVEANAILKQAPDKLSDEDKLSKVELYKLERLLHLVANQLTTAFTITALPETYKAKVTKLNTQDESVEVIDEAGKVHHLSLADLSIQPNPSLKPLHPLKYINMNPEDRFVNADTLRKSYIRYEYSMNVSAPPYVNIDNKYELAIVDAQVPEIAKAVSSVLTRSLNDAKYTNGGYLPPPIAERVQLELISPYGIAYVWGVTGHRFVLSREAKEGMREIISTAVVSRSRDGIFFFTSKFNNMRHSTLRYDLGLDHSADGNPEHKWFDKFWFPAVEQYKPARFHHFANFVVEKEGVRNQGIARLMLESIIQNYSKEYIEATEAKVTHSQRLLCGRGFWQIGDPPWLARMSKLGFKQRLGCETFHVETDWDPLIPTLDKDGRKIEHVPYNQSFGMPQLYLNMLAKKDAASQQVYQDALSDPEDIHLFSRIPQVIGKSLSGKAKLQYFQLIRLFKPKPDCKANSSEAKDVSQQQDVRIKPNAS
jgi:hypothetical protein